MPEYSRTAASCIAVAPSATPPHPSPQLRHSPRPSPRTSAFVCALAGFVCGRTHTDPAKPHTRPPSEQTGHGLDITIHQDNRNKINKSDRASHFLLFYRWSQALNTGSHLVKSDSSTKSSSSNMTEADLRYTAASHESVDPKHRRPGAQLHRQHNPEGDATW